MVANFDPAHLPTCPLEPTARESSPVGRRRPPHVGLPESESALIERVVRGERGACDQFVARYSGFVLSLARRRYGFDGDRAQDVLQSTLMHLTNHGYRALRAWRGEARFTTYLAVIVGRLCREENERGRRLAAVALEDVTLVCGSPLPDERLARRQRRALVIEGLSRLSARDRRLLTLRYRGDLGPSEIAERLGAKSGTIRKALHDARRRLRLHLDATPARAELG